MVNGFVIKGLNRHLLCSQLEINNHQFLWVSWTKLDIRHFSMHAYLHAYLINSWGSLGYWSDECCQNFSILDISYATKHAIIVDIIGITAGYSFNCQNFTLVLPCSLTHSLTQSLAHSLTHSLTHWFTHSLT